MPAQFTPAQFGLERSSRNVQVAFQRHFNDAGSYLAALVDRRRDNGDGGVGADGVDTDLLEKAFDFPPNKYSALALESYLIHMCFEKNRGISTAEAIVSTFTHYWFHMDGSYAGTYARCPESDTITGCPARSVVIRHTVDIIRERGRYPSFCEDAASVSLSELARMMESDGRAEVLEAFSNLVRGP
ncbi:hypothetical protein Hypma_008295 [Hypsizygus marmoreus]|uniref:Uncharacterized protein n=1 Tax=Hypsizygus marmoreus TaxID=39966 RepID=A0A369JT33_HYPMA|nr:hypothetical protein Hypma_008295 [Hypsizygus marmoreus]